MFYQRLHVLFYFLAVLSVNFTNNSPHLLLVNLLPFVCFKVDISHRADERKLRIELRDDLDVKAARRLWHSAVIKVFTKLVESRDDCEPVETYKYLLKYGTPFSYFQVGGFFVQLHLSITN